MPAGRGRHADRGRGTGTPQAVRGHRGGRRRLASPCEEGEIFGILGPNGAGKTTTVECIEGLREPDGGEISVLGPRPPAGPGRADPACSACSSRTAQLPDRLRVAEALELYSSFYRDPADWRGADGRARAGGQARHHVRASCPAARSSGCRSRWRWSAARGSRCSTSSPPAWTRRPGATPGS